MHTILMWLDFVYNFSLRFFCLSFFKASLHNLTMFHEAHLVQRIQVRLVQELDFHILLGLGFLGVEDIAGARPSLKQFIEVTLGLFQLSRCASLIRPIVDLFNLFTNRGLLRGLDSGSFRAHHNSVLPACAAVALIRLFLRVMSGLLVLLLRLSRLILYTLVPPGRCIYNVLFD